MNIKKLFATLAGVSLFAQTVVPSASVFGAGYSQELEDAYNWAYGKSITTMSPIENANMYGAITRAEMAKMLANWAKDKGETPDTSKACNFSDTASVKGDLATAIVEACQLGLMGQGITSFRPYDTISRAEFGTALSRALWGNKYEGGTPYYTNHLNALKAAGIMTQIANAESTKEVRGYVMLMLMRSEGGSEVSDETDCDDPLVVLACNSDSDACPAACKEDSKDEDEVVKSGDLDVEVSGTNGNLFIGRDSELDTITLKTSEEVSISKIVLERIGYSTKDNIVSVKLEDDKWATIADAKTLDSKGQVKLTLKKDYKVVDGELNAVIVVNTLDDWSTKALQPGATVGFKVVDVESTAKNVNISGKANTYTAIKFDGSTLTFSRTKATSNKEYNWESGELYEVAKFKVQAPDDSSIVLRGFTFAKGNGTLDLRKYFDKAEITVAGEKVSGLEANVNKDDELVVTFKDVEVPAKKKQEVIVKIALSDDFDQFGLTYGKAELALKDFVAVDGKVESRVKASNTLKDTVKEYYGYFTAYVFNGWKIKFANVKLGNVDAAQNSEDILVAEGTVTTDEALKWSFTINASGKWAGAIKQMSVIVNGEETEANPTLVKYGVSSADTDAATNAPDAWVKNHSYSANDIVKYDDVVYLAKAGHTSAATFDATKWTPAYTQYSFTFSNVEIDKSGKIKFNVDIYDSNVWDSQTVEFGTFNFASFNGTLKYEDANKLVANEVSGSISFSKVTIQPSKASLKNNASKAVEFANKATRTEVVFDGTYTAKKGDIELNEFDIVSTDAEPHNALNTKLADNTVTFHVFIDNEEVADEKLVCENVSTSAYCHANDTFTNVKVKAGESVKVRVEAEVEANNTASDFSSLSLGKYKVNIWGEDVNGNSNSGKWDANTVELKVVDKGSVNVSTSATKQTILRKASDALIAQFTVKPANGASSVDLETISFDISGNGSSNITLTVDDIEEDDYSGTTSRTYSMNRDVNSDGVVVKITLDDEMTWTVSLTNIKVNGKNVSKTFTKRYVEAAVEIVKQAQSSNNTQTIFTLGVDADSDVDVKHFVMYNDASTPVAINTAIIAKTFEDWQTLSVTNTNSVQNVGKVTYKYTNGNTFDGTTCKSSLGATVTITDAQKTAANADLVAEWIETPSDAQKTKEACEWSTEEITKTALEDYFKIGDESVVVSNLKN